MFSSSKATAHAPAGDSLEASVTEYLGTDHVRLDSIFTAARTAAHACDWALAGERFEEFGRGLRRHIALEEEVLFPVFERQTGMSDYGPTAVMRGEHREIELILASLKLAIEKTSAPLFEQGAQSLGQVLWSHNRKEELVLYPRCDDLLGAERATVVSEMEQR